MSIQRILLRTAIPLAAVLALVQPAPGFSLFGDAKSDAISAIRKADRIVARADGAYDGGNPDQAVALYRKAADIFSRVEKDFPGIDEGTARLHLVYCEDQIRRIEGTRTGGDDDAGLVPAADFRMSPLPPPAGAGAFPEDSDETEEQAAAEGEAPALADPLPPPPLEVGPMLREARALLEDGNLDAAAETVVDILRSDPQNRSARLMMGVVRCRQRRFDEALVALEDLQAEEEDEPVLLALAAVYQATGRPNLALLSLSNAIQRNPKHSAPYIDMAWLMFSQGELEDAEANYRAAVRLGAKRDLQLERRLGF